MRVNLYNQLWDETAVCLDSRAQQLYKRPYVLMINFVSFFICMLFYIFHSRTNSKFID